MRRAWIFDLDDTLHDAGHRLLPHINRAMTDYVIRHLDVDERRANEVRVLYWRRYGATLLGLMRNHGIDPHHFLWHTHQFDDLPGMVLAHPALAHALRRLPGRKFVFTNAPQHYASAVLRALGLQREFEAVFSIEHTGFRPKPQAAGFRRLLHRHGLHPRSCIMVEDSLPNLVTARRLGMRTVLVGPGAARSAVVDVAVRSVTELPRWLDAL